jgi:protoporphyrinogen oxidase
MLVRQRKSRIYFLRKFFAYPIQLTSDTLRNLGVKRVLRIGFSYLKTLLFPPKRVENLEQFFISRFGKELYLTFFKSYTEKVWGVPCEEISAEWGAQRIKGLSIKNTLLHLAKKLGKRSSDLRQKDTETSLIEQFLYPKLGPGQLWEVVAEKVKALGGEIRTHQEVTSIHTDQGRITAVSVRGPDGVERQVAGNYFFSTMPIKELVSGLQAAVPAKVSEVSSNLQYRDFITVGLLVKKLSVRDRGNPTGRIQDNWIYIQEPEVLAGRLQIFNNWSPYMVKDPETVWIGVEYFCYETDSMWNLPDTEMASLAARELERIAIIESQDVIDFKVIRMPKTYPAYFGVYNRFEEVRSYLDAFPNLFLVGRNGMHKYNNQDHSMLTAMTAVDNIIEGRTDKSNIWEVNTERDYHEEKAAPSPTTPATPGRDVAA